MIDLSPGWAFVVGWATCGMAVALWLDRNRRRDITDDDRACARIDAELDRGEYMAAAETLAARLEAERGSRTRHPSRERGCPVTPVDVLPVGRIRATPVDEWAEQVAQGAYPLRQDPVLSREATAEALDLVESMGDIIGYIPCEVAALLRTLVARRDEAAAVVAGWARAVMTP